MKWVIQLGHLCCAPLIHRSLRNRCCSGCLAAAWCRGSTVAGGVGICGRGAGPTSASFCRLRASISSGRSARVAVGMAGVGGSGSDGSCGCGADDGRIAG